MLKRTIFAVAVAALTLPTGVVAQENATITLRSGEKVNGQLVDMGGAGFAVKVNGQDRQIPTGDVAVIDFGTGDLSDADWGKFTGSNAVFLKSGQTINGQLYDISGTTPLKITFKTDSGDRELSSSEIGRIVLARPNSAVPTTGGGQGGGVAVPGNQAWTPTGITVRRGEQITFNSTGDVKYGPDQADMASPAGARSQRFEQNAPLPGNYVGALIARVGNGEPFPIGGPTATVAMPANGQLFLGINDSIVNDNSGEFRVTITRRNTRR
jgi:hypothetical protein